MGEAIKKAFEGLSERILFGLLIIAGYIGGMIVLSWSTIPPANLNLLSQMVGALGTAVGVIVAAIWKTDKTERLQADTVNKLATGMADNASTNAEPSRGGNPFANK